MIKIAPSILSADFARLGEDIRTVETADYLHFDVMDGLFVPNISIGIPVLQSVRKATDMVLDVHLMITEPVRYAAEFVKAGADILVFHVESQAPDKTQDAIRKVRAMGARVGLSVRPKTQWEILLPYLDSLDLVLVMTVEPGFGGQAFMQDQLPKIAALRREIDRRASGASWRSTAASTWRRRGFAWRRGRMCSSPAAPCSARPTAPI